MKTNEFISKGYLYSRFWNIGLSLWVAWVPLRVALASLSGRSGHCTLASELKYWPTDAAKQLDNMIAKNAAPQAKEVLPVTADKNWVIVTPEQIQ